MNNKKSGNQFEAELCEILSQHGFWCHNLAQNSAGQPADVIAVKNGSAYLIDCKVCSTGIFSHRRIEENQSLAMDLWRECGNGTGWFALKFGDDIYMVPNTTMTILCKHHSSLSKRLLEMSNFTLERWMETRA